MKSFILLVLFSTYIFAATSYRIPNMVVEENNMYCSSYDGKYLEVLKPGDIVSGEQALNYCSYNYETAEHKRQATVKINTASDEFKVILFTLLLIFTIGLFVLSIRSV